VHAMRAGAPSPSIISDKLAHLWRRGSQGPCRRCERRDFRMPKPCAGAGGDQVRRPAQLHARLALPFAHGRCQVVPRSTCTPRPNAPHLTFNQAGAQTSSMHSAH
jgi:hypothetical protein